MKLDRLLDHSTMDLLQHHRLPLDQIVVAVMDVAAVGGDEMTRA